MIRKNIIKLSFLRNQRITFSHIRDVESTPDNALLFHKCKYLLGGIKFYDYCYFYSDTLYCNRYIENVLHRCIFNI